MDIYRFKRVVSRLTYEDHRVQNVGIRIEEGFVSYEFKLNSEGNHLDICSYLHSINDELRDVAFAEVHRRNDEWTVEITYRPVDQIEYLDLKTFLESLS